jgi:hypothetical protein
VATRDIGNLGIWPKRLLDDPRLLVLAPPPPPLRPQDLAPHLPPVLKYVLKDVLYRPGTSSKPLHGGQRFRIYEGVGTSLTLIGRGQHLRLDGAELGHLLLELDEILLQPLCLRRQGLGRLMANSTCR